MNPQRMARAQAIITIFWVLMVPVSIYRHWLSSVVYVSALSLWALVASHGAWWAAASAEARQMREDVAGDVVTAVVAETTLEEEDGKTQRNKNQKESTGESTARSQSQRQQKNPRKKATAAKQKQKPKR